MDSVGQKRMAALHGGRRDKLEVSPNLWAGVGLVRGGAGTALVGDPETVAARMKEYMALGIDTFILSGYPHLEEAYRFAELVFPLLPLAHVLEPAEPRPIVGPVRRDDRQRRAAGRPATAASHDAQRAGIEGIARTAVLLGCCRSGFGRCGRSRPAAASSSAPAAGAQRRRRGLLGAAQDGSAARTTADQHRARAEGPR